MSTQRCGCVMVTDAVDPYIDYCDLHAAAPDLLAALKGLQLHHKKIPYSLGACAASCPACQRSAAIAKAEERP